MIDLPERFGASHFVRHVAQLHRKAVCAKNLRRSRIDGHEGVRVDCQLLERREVEGSVSFERPAENAAPLDLAERRLVPRDPIAERIEALEVILRIEGVIAVEAEGRAPEVVRSAPGHDVHDTARGLAEFGGIGVGQDLELPDGFLAEGGSHGADGRVVVVEAVDHHVVGASPLAREGQAARPGRALLRRPVSSDPGCDDGEAQEVAGVDGQVLDLVLPDHRRDGRVSGIDHRRLGDDDDFVPDGRQLDGQVE